MSRPGITPVILVTHRSNPLGANRIRMTPIVCGQGRRSSSERNPPTAAAQAERSLFREAMGSGRRGWLTKPPPCGRCGLSPSFGEVGKLRRAARRNQGSSDLTELSNRPTGWSFGSEGDPNGTRRLRPDGTAEPNRGLVLRRGPDGKFAVSLLRRHIARNVAGATSSGGIRTEPDWSFGSNGNRTGSMRGLRASPIAPEVEQERPVGSVQARTRRDGKPRPSGFGDSGSTQ